MQFSRLIAPLATALSLIAAPLAMAENGVTADTIVLGHSGDHSGPIKGIGDDYLAGAQLYFDRTNASGGVNGRQIKLVTTDDGYKADVAEGNTRLLIQRDKVFALFGFVGTGTSEAAIKVANEFKVPFVAPYSGSMSIRQPLDPLVFHMRAPYDQEFEKMADYFAGLSMNSIAVIHLNNGIGNYTAKATEAALQKRGIKPVLIAPIQTDGSDADAVMKKVVNAAPAAVILLSAGKSSSAFMRELLQEDLRPMIFAWSAVSTHTMLHDLGDKVHGLVVSQIVPSPYNGGTAIAREYQQAAKAKGEEVSYSAIEGYMAAKLMVEGLRRAGKDLTREKLIAALESIDHWDMGGMVVSMSATDHGASDMIDLSSISKGRFR